MEEENKDIFIDENLKEELENPKEKIRYCENPRCNKILNDSKRPKYCSEICRTRHSAMRQYTKLKDDKKFKEKRNEKNRKYYEKNKEEFKAKMRVYGMKYYFRKRDEKRKLEEQQKEEIKNGDNRSSRENTN